MKKSNKTYLLLAIVLGVWGIIGFQVIRTINPVQEQLASVTSKEIFVPKQVKERDTFSIVADYRDPFLGVVRRPTKNPNTLVNKTIPPSAPQKRVRYTGFIGDKSGKQPIFFVTIENQQYMMGVNETQEGVTLLGGTANKVRVRYNGKSKTLALNQ